KNEYIQQHRFQFLLGVFRSFTNPLILLLIFASCISVIVGETRDFYIITSIICVSSFVSFLQHYKAEHQAEKLKQKVILTTTAIRDGLEKEIAFSHITVGDIVLLAVGDIVPADCRLLETKDVSIDESSLTGESFPITKNSEV